MAINPCKECGGPVSDKAESCPMCGAKQKKKISILAWIGLVFLVVFGMGMCVDKVSTNKHSTGQSTSKDENAVESLEAKKIESTEKNWKYDSTKDEMRGIESKYAVAVSSNTVNFDFPYSGGSKLILTLRKKGNETDVMVAISKGQFLCGFRGCEAAFKFDDGNIQSITMSDPDNHASDLLFVAYDKTEHKIIQQLKNSKKLVIEVQFYREGKKQFIFDVSGLNWH